MIYGTPEVCVVGHVTKDIIEIDGVEEERPGGVAYHFSIASKALGSEVSVITKIAPGDEYLLDDLNDEKIQILFGSTKSTSVFENIYPERNVDFRIQNIRSIASQFSIEEIFHEIRAKIFHIGPLTNGDIPIDLLRYLSKKGRISLDVQGFLREKKKGEVIEEDWEEKREGLSYVHILKANEMEAKILSGRERIREAAVELSKWGPDEVIITLGSRGSLIYSKGIFHPIPVFPQREIVDPTGCGDTYMAGYIYKRLRCCDLNEVGRFAAALSSLKLERSGPFA
jgi:sugar/nucleoside kinase (ribokinase family)